MPFLNRYKLLGASAGFVYRLYSSTWSYRVHFVENARPLDFYTKHLDQSYAFGHWHGDELGIEVIRGSSTSGGTRALVAMLRKLNEGHYYVPFALDGPNGLRFEAKPGVHFFAYKAGIPLYQCLVTCNRKWQIPNTWNKAYVPKPFAKIDLYLYPMPQATKSNRDEVLRAFNSRTTISSSSTP
jgi:lysophospholipid acyltransferase (LPLAT)-like uncharacterized protein